MTVWAVSGSAGYGKTYRLMQRMAEELRVTPLANGQSVLALTFMHGARQRLEQKLRTVPGLRGKYDCMTVDGFARSVRSRWRSLSAAIGQPATDEVDFDEQCALCADLVRRPTVGCWLQMGYPLVVLDEGQDLDMHRLRLVQALAGWGRLLIAYDDFQCLRQELRPSPVSEWLPLVCKPEVLEKPKRTKVPGLLEAATALRSGLAPSEGKGFKIAECIGAGQAAALIASKLYYAMANKSVAVITPSRAKGYADGLIEKVSTSACGTKKLGPFRVDWESGESSFLEDIKRLAFDRAKPSTELLALLGEMEESSAQASLVRWVIRQRDIAGRQHLNHADLLCQARRVVATQRARAHRSDNGRRALTVHQAKNREFDGVIVIWPYTVGSDDEGKRRLLYNAITRAKQWCVVIVQGMGSTLKAPFR
jgi:superfamily I DNA/RNA helicase